MILTKCLIKQNMKHEEDASDRHCIKILDHAKMFVLRLIDDITLCKFST